MEKEEVSQVMEENIVKYIKLKHIAKITMGQSPESKSYNNERKGLPFYQGKSDFGKINPVPRVWCSNPIKVAEKDDIIISVRAPIGDTNIVIEKCCIGRGLAAITPLDDKVDSKYLYYVINSKYEELNKCGVGSTFKAITKDILCDLKLKEIPNIKIQLDVVRKLDIIGEIIEIRKNQIECLDNIVKSLFVEMFGDPNLNEKNWNEVKVIDVCDCMVPARDKPKSFTGIIPWITIEDLKVNSITYHSKNKLGLTDEEVNEVKRKKIPIGSVIMSCVGNLGVCSIAGEEMVINQQLHSFQCKGKVNNIFLMYMLGERKSYMEKNASSTTVLYMNKTICNSIPIYLPPIELQKQFADIVKQIDKQKFEIHKSLEQMELLKESLINNFFC